MRGRKGTILVLVVAGVATVGAIGAWVVDGAMLLRARGKQQAAADAGALAAAFALPGKGDAAARAAAIDFAARNGYAIPPGDVTFWDRPGGQGRAVTVTVQAPVDLGFSKLFGTAKRTVGARASATLGDVGEVPRGALPFGVPAEKAPGGGWRVLAAEDDGAGGRHGCGGSSHGSDGFSALDMSPPTRILLKAGAGGGVGGNFLPLAVGGCGGSHYRDAIVDGMSEPVRIGSNVDTEPGNMVGPTVAGVMERLAKGAKYADVYVPLIDRDDWEDGHGRHTVTVVGVMAVHLDPDVVHGEVTGTFTDVVLAADPVLGGGASPGVHAPILIPTPGS